MNNPAELFQNNAEAFIPKCSTEASHISHLMLCNSACAVSFLNLWDVTSSLHHA